VPLLATSALAQATFSPCWKRQATGADGSSQKRIARQRLSALVDKVNLKPGGIVLSINLPLPVDGTHGAAAMLPITRFFALRMRMGSQRLAGYDHPAR
jgi:hypothetical protein